MPALGALGLARADLAFCCSLVSSFLTTLFCADGEIKDMEESDACGMNLWGEFCLLGVLLSLRPRAWAKFADSRCPSTLADLETGNGWDKELLAYVAGGEKEADELERKLGPIEKDGGVAAGKIGSWFVKRYGMNEGKVHSRFSSIDLAHSSASNNRMPRQPLHRRQPRHDPLLLASHWRSRGLSRNQRHHPSLHHRLRP